MVRLDLDDGSTINSRTTDAKSLASALQTRVSSDVHPERILHNVQRNTAISLGHFAPNRSCRGLVTLSDQLLHAEDR